MGLKWPIFQRIYWYPMSDEPERLRVPRTAEEVKHLIAYRPPWWEYLLFGGLLAQGKEALEPKWRDYEIGYVHPTGQSIDDLHAWTFLQSTMGAARVTADNIPRIL